MEWAEEWSRAVINASSRKGWPLFSSKDFASWYDLQLKYSNYPGILLKKIQNRLDIRSTLLDIGAGTGAFAVPIAKTVRRVTAIEPSLAMSSIMAKKMNGLKNMHIINQWWEDISINDLGMHDTVIAANSLYRIKDIIPALKKMISLAEKNIFIIMSCGSCFYHQIWQEFKKEQYCPAPSFIFLYNILCQLKILASIEMVKKTHSHIYKDIGQAADYWQARLGLCPGQRDSLVNYLESRLMRKNGVLCLEEQGHDALIWYEK